MAQKSQVVAAVYDTDSDAGRVVGRSLKSLRESVGLTQKQMAERLCIGQAAVSKIEARGDVQISSLQKYVEALGAALRIEAAFPASGELALRLRTELNLNTLESHQLVLPIFGDDCIADSSRDVVLSIRPQYSEKIMEGKKTVELRRRFPMSTSKGSIVYIYSTSPVRAMVGSAEISDVIKMSVADIWEQYSDCAFIKKEDFDVYFSGVEEGYALEFSNVRPLPRPLKLNELRERFGFQPPQSFLYAKPDLRRALKDEYANVSD